MEVKFDRSDKKYFIKKKMSNKQTFYMGADQIWKTSDGIRYYNICLAIYNKRKSAARNEQICLMTGRDPFESVSLALKAIKLLEERIAEDHPGKAVLIVEWTTNRRRDGYAKVLLKRNWSFSKLEGRCVLRKDL